MQFIPGFFGGLFKKTTVKDSEVKAKAKDNKISGPSPDESTPSKRRGESHIIL